MQYNSTNNNAPNSNAPSNASSNAPLDDTQLNKSTDENTEVTLIRTGYNRELFRSTFNTEFKELGVAEQDLSFFDPNLVII